MCILGTFVYGSYLGSSEQSGWARDVYLSFRQNDLRLAYLCQVGVGLPTLPALVQANRFYSGKDPLWNGFMAPPKVNFRDPGEKTLHDCTVTCPRLFEMGTVYTMIAGLLNVLAIFDACYGPVPAETPRRWRQFRRRAGRSPRRRQRARGAQSERPRGRIGEEAVTNDLWYSLPLIVSVSLVYAATRHETLGPILAHAFRVGLWTVGFMVLIFAVLLLISLQV